jgi:hypothetical protein
MGHSAVKEPSVPAGPGKVIFAAGTQFVVPEWFGAVANGAADDSAAIQAAYDAAKQTGASPLCRKPPCKVHCPQGAAPRRLLAATHTAPTLRLTAGWLPLAAGNAMLYLAGTYGIGTAVELRFKPGGMIMADTKASFVAVNGQTKGITFTIGSELRCRLGSCPVALLPPCHERVYT